MTDSKPIRVFTAVSLPEPLIFFLKELQKEIKKEFPTLKGSWVRAERMHLTLKFFGDIRQTELAAIKEAMSEAAAQSEPPLLHAGGCGVFPSVKKAGVLWSGVKGETRLLSSLHDTLGTALAKRGFPKEKRRFSPHFTLARLKGRPHHSTLLKIIKRHQHHRSEPFHCNSIHLFKSDLKPSGAVHTRLFTARLNHYK